MWTTTVCLVPPNLFGGGTQAMSSPVRAAAACGDPQKDFEEPGACGGVWAGNVHVGV